jgi:hypothetical protein
MINIAQTGPRWVAKLNLVDSRGPRVPSQGVLAAILWPKYLSGGSMHGDIPAVGKGCRVSISAGDLQEVRYAR